MDTIEMDADGSPAPPRHGRTTIALTRDGDGRWRATQRGVDIEATGETAAAAAAAYCRRVDEREG